MEEGAYTQKQLRYIAAFGRQAELSISQLFIDFDTKKSLSISTTEGATNAANVLSAGVAIGAVATAAPSVGTSIGAAIAVIAVIQTAQFCYKVVREAKDTTTPAYSPDQELADNLRLNLRILLREVAFSAAIRYRYIIETRLDDREISVFAQYASIQVMRKITKIISADLQANITGEELLNYLIKSSNIKRKMADPYFLTISTPNKKKNKGLKTHCKKLYALAEWALYNENEGNKDYVLMASKPGSSLSMLDITSEDYGYMVVSEQLLNSEQKIAIDTKSLKQVTIKKTHQYEETKQQFCHYHLVTREEVIVYIDSLSPTDGSITRSLNQYLSLFFGKNVIAACHDNRLRGLNLNHGNFSEVNFSSADLSNCSLKNTIWKQAHIQKAIFYKNKLDNANFESVFAEKSQWNDIIFTGNFSHAKMNGAKLNQCTFTHTLHHLGCDWEFAEIKSQSFDNSQLRQFEKQLNEEYQARVDLEFKVHELVKNYDEIKAHITHSQLFELNPNQLSTIENKIIAIQTTQDSCINNKELTNLLLSLHRNVSELRRSLNKHASHEQLLTARLRALESIIITKKEYAHLSTYFFNPQEQLFEKIEAMKQYGQQLADKHVLKGQEIIALAKALHDKADDFYKQPSTADFSTFQEEFLTLLNSKNQIMGAYRVSWPTIIKNITIALTVVGLLLIAAKLVHSRLTEGRGLFFFQKNRTSSEEHLENIKHCLALTHISH